MKHNPKAATNAAGRSAGTDRTEQTRTFLTEWFGRLQDSGWTAEVFLSALADDLVWTATGSSPVSGVWRGKDAYVANVYQPLDRHLTTWPKPIVERIFADGDWGIVMFDSTGGLGRNGTDYNMRYCWAIRLRDQLIVEVVGYYDTACVDRLFR